MVIQMRREAEAILRLPRESGSKEAAAKLRASKKLARKGVRELDAAHQAIKKGIAESIQKATDARTLTFREGFLSFVNKRHGSCAFLTTNWDLLLEKHLAAGRGDPDRVVHLHGSVKDHTKMLLPGEIISEPYRPSAETAAMQWNLKTTWKIFEAAKCFVVYGHSLSGIEAELRLVLQLGFSAHPAHPEILVVSGSVEESKAIARRLLPLLPAGVPGKIVTLRGDK